ncbi:N-acetylmuramoyl-L-alanine amidase [Candidatus Dojkabacteria bacterium]|uniref:N-acetylmuramoyl-L-alanine amidase n=1 Tax=Candidatus Dojkabacteria bacterium TaxID=2099670 RepID=A0A955RM75_9BACT|nr:N-acetylmuramoyl-L-alanine amidase [Candidatus Dojkabacteria bacterium]
MNIVWKPVRNKSNGRFGYKPEAIVIHIAEGWLNGAYSWFNNPSSQASAHYMIGKNGVIWQFVADEDTAWHAGGVNQPRWALLKPRINPNLYTIGIEHEGFTGEVWTDEMYEASSELITSLCTKYKIPLDRNHIIGHNQINSVSRDRCPGTGVNFDKLIELAKTKYEDPVIIKELNEKIAVLEKKVNELEDANSGLAKENEILKVKNQQLQNLVKSYTDTPADVAGLKQENAKLRTEIQNLQENQKRLNSKIKALESRLDSDSESRDNEDEDDETFLESLWGFIRGK